MTRAAPPRLDPAMAPSLHAAALIGIDARVVEIEARILRGQMGRFVLTGLPGAAVLEARERVKAAIAASGFRFPRQSLLVHLAPADLRKDGPLLDLPIALAALAASDQLALPPERRILAVGELALDGRVRPVRGLLPIAVAAKAAGFDCVLAPAAGAELAALARGVPILPVATLTEAVGYLNGLLELAPARPAETAAAPPADTLDDVRGQAEAKRALAIAAAGLHNILLVGPPGSGKTMLARRLASLLPDLEDAEAIEVARIRSAVEPGSFARPRRPPFRAPHHTCSPAALVGGGPQLRPGEISLAHRGVLFLDEFPEFARNAIEALRQPLEERVVTVVRAAGAVVFPADLCLVAAMNPCPCGWRGHRGRVCRCTDGQILAYAGRISGPLLDRIDLIVEVPALPIEDLLEPRTESGAAAAAKSVRAARAAQARRLGGEAASTNSAMTERAVERHCTLGAGERELLRRAAERHQLSARSVSRALRVARTAADLRGAANIAAEDLAFALACRVTPWAADP